MFLQVKRQNRTQQAMHQSHSKMSPHHFSASASLYTPGVERILRKLMYVRCFHTSASNYEIAECQPRHWVKKKTSYQQERLIRKQWLTSTVRENRGFKVDFVWETCHAGQKLPTAEIHIMPQPKGKKLKNQLNRRETYKTNLTLQTHDVILWESVYHLNTINRKKIYRF